MWTYPPLLVRMRLGVDCFTMLKYVDNDGILYLSTFLDNYQVIIIC